jgi:hypothetical protein
MRVWIENVYACVCKDCKDVSVQNVFTDEPARVASKDVSIEHASKDVAVRIASNDVYLKNVCKICI